MLRGWPLPELYVNRYISALAHSGDERAPDIARDRVFIEEEEEGEEENTMEKEDGTRRQSMQTDRSSRKSRIFIKDDDDY